MQTPPDQPDGPLHAPGTVVFRSHPPRDGTNVEVLRADPVIWVDGQLMTLIRRGESPCTTSTHHGHMELLTITARNGTWIYLVESYDPGRDVYRCHWPD